MRDEKTTILIVEDDPTLRTLLRKILERSNYSVVAASDAQEALHMASQQVDSIALLVSDIQMPGMKGDELARKLKSLFPNLLILLVSGYSQHRLELEDGWRFIQKPYSPKTIADTICEMLAAQQPSSDSVSAGT